MFFVEKNDGGIPFEVRERSDENRVDLVEEIVQVKRQIVGQRTETQKLGDVQVWDSHFLKMGT